MAPDEQECSAIEQARSKSSSWNKNDSPTLGVESRGVEWRNPLVPPQKLRNEMGKSHQSGWVVLRGKKWYGYYRRTVLDPITNERKADVVSVILGLRSQLTKGVAREALQKEIAKQTGQNLGGRIMKDGSVTFGWFVRNRYYPLRDWRPETEKVKKIQIERDLVAPDYRFYCAALDGAFVQFLCRHCLRLLR